MHFFYLDETGCSGADLNPAQDPIFVLGGLSVKDQGWVETTRRFRRVLTNYFGAPLPPDFELHAHELLSPNGSGRFEGHERVRRSQLAMDLLALLADRQHQVHYVALDKVALRDTGLGTESSTYNARIPYLQTTCAFTEINGLRT